LREQLGEQARTWVTRYSWVDIAGELLEVFDQTQTHYQPQTVNTELCCRD
jgi:hypothetical protein